MQTAIIATTALIALSPMVNAGNAFGRPTRPKNPVAAAHRLDGGQVRPSLTEVEELVTRAQTQKDQERVKQKPKNDELRQQVRTQVSEIRTENRRILLDILDSLQAAEEKAQEQLRKIREEQKAKEREDRRQEIKLARDEFKAALASIREEAGKKATEQRLALSGR